MTQIGGKSQQQVLNNLECMTQNVTAIELKEYQQRIQKACQLMAANNIDVIYINAGTNLYYFTGTLWYASERLVGALLFKNGDLHYICPHFEKNTLALHTIIKADINCWHEHESPYQLVANLIDAHSKQNINLAIDESTAFFISNGIKTAAPNLNLLDAKPVITGCRQIKSQHELQLLQQAKNITLAVQKAAASILYQGISVAEVAEFIHQAHIKLGANQGSYFCIVLFGGDTAYPHGVKHPKNLETNDMVLIDTGCCIEGYHSDITRSYVFGRANERQQQMWLVEKNAQAAAFNAAKLGKPCSDVDLAARQYLASQGFGPEYQTPGCPHRTGHGIGLDIHEWPYLVKSESTPLQAGMCFSNEPMLVLPNEFGVRLEDHFYMTEQGPKWFTEPSPSIEQPF